MNRRQSRQATVLVALALVVHCRPATSETTAQRLHWRYETAQPRGVDVYAFVLRAGQRAQIWVRGDGTANVDCYAYDNRGHLIDADSDLTDACLLRWTSANDNRFTVAIHNRGNRATDYYIEALRSP
jgi:hypothetical protein